MNYIDSHAHIFSEEFKDDFHDVCLRAKENGVHRIMIITTRVEEAKQAIAFSRQDPYRYQVAFGIHPEDVQIANDDLLKQVREIVSMPEVSAVGEIGLDYYWDKEHAEEQKQLFIEQIKIANEVNKPILVHSRDAMQDTYDIMVNNPSRGLMHCFAGSAEMGIEFVKKGYYIALGGAATFKNARHSLEVCKAIDVRYLLTETDCPYMSPEPLRGRRNEPANIPYIAKKLAETKGMELEEFVEQINQNYARFLGENNE